MASYDHRTLEAQEQVLPDGIDRLEPATVDPRRDARDLTSRIRALGLDAHADEYLQTAGCTMERVSLRHPRSVPEGCGQPARRRGTTSDPASDTQSLRTAWAADGI